MRNRSEVLARYEVENGRIKSDRLARHDSQMFIGERLYVPYFWSKYLEGWNDDVHEESGDPLFVILHEDIAEFPELLSRSGDNGDRVLRLHHHYSYHAYNYYGAVEEINLDGTSIEKPQVPPRSVYLDGWKDGFEGQSPKVLDPDYLRAYADGVEERRAQ